MESVTSNLKDSNMSNEIDQDNDLASRWSRLGAALIDMLITLLIILPLMYFAGGFDGISEGAQPPLIYSIIMLIISIAISLAIHGKFLVRDGQTLGKKFLKGNSD